jgi:hypothetical protein
MRRPRGYGSYRGKSGFHNFLKILIVILALALALLVAAYFFLRQFAVVTDDGIWYDIPFLRPVEPSPSASLPPVIITSPTPVPTPVPTPTPMPAEPPLRAVALPRTALYDGTAENLVQEAGGNAALFDMKADDGTLGYLSELELSKAVRTSDSNPVINAAIRSLTGSGLYTVARISCFKDDTTPHRDNSLSIKTNSGYNWKDAAGIRWASPASDAMRKYLADICVELARLGFDEILLDNAGYPIQGRLDYIKAGSAYDRNKFTDSIDQFYRQVKEALAPYPEVKLSIRTTEGALSGVDTLSGQTAASLARSADRIWVDPSAADGVDYTALLSAAGLKNPSDKLVFTAPQAGEGETSWAIFEWAKP